MCDVFRRVCAIGSGAVILGLALVSAAGAQGVPADVMHNATRLGGSTSFYSPPLRSAASLNQMVARRGMAEDIRTVLREAGIPETGDAVIATLSGATTSLKGGTCDSAVPADGIIVDCEFQTGSTLRWMAYRPDARKGIRTPGRIDNVRWAGKKPFKALLFRVTNDYKIYTFILPMACSNLSLMSVTEIKGEPVDVSVDRMCDPKTGSLRATFKASGKDLERVRRLGVTLNGQPAGELIASSWTLVVTRPGEYTFDATDTMGRAYGVASRTLRVEACPPPPPEPVKQLVAPTCAVDLSFIRVRGGYEISVDATRSTTGTSGVAPTVTVVLRDAAGVEVGQPLTLDSTRTGKIVARRAGTYHATATVTTPQGVEVGAYRYEGTTTCEASVTAERPASAMTVFFDALGGKERRVRPIENTDLEFGQCSPLIGLKLGIAKRFRNDWELGGVLGGAISLAGGDDKVRESALYVDVEVNKYLRGGSFIGTGLSLWDLTRSDTFTPAWLLHFGVPLAKHARHPVYFIAEGRLFFDHIDNISSNYLFWAGVRVHFRGR